ncbi:thioredoxin domain-containing protein [Sphingomonas piscis]|uniref:Thioredoxin domain-containing protein n=1 Tax=Sphingomonas piscis TaxID=2714943 RepID=A0A6G7YNT8_9SPHN|nr:thioredoxin domain-containing protein [Sphingomonas piscis]QIK78408.1 thioredoxin domain-containing protein [Sphingomonas piscis]
MRLVRLFAFLLLALPLASANAAPKLWTRVVAATSEGGFRIGNPAAKVKLVEYGSLTCPHCRAFDEESWLPLSAFVRKGTVSFEYRNYILNGVDVAASLIARCNGAASFFPTARELYATQPQWLGKIRSMSEQDRAALLALPDQERSVRIAEAAGLVAIGQKHGVTPARARACLTNQAGMTRLDQLHDSGAADGVNGTPTFFINGKMISGKTWPEVAEAIKAAGG